MSCELPLVTIMIPTYQQAAILGVAIESALAQDYPALEVVVIDDASPDDTPDVVARYTSDSRFRAVRHAQNMGRVATYRDALHHHARGELVLNLDGDDWLCDPTYISAAVALLRADEGVVVVFARLKVYQENSGSFEEDTAVWDIPTHCDGNDVFLRYATGAAIPHPTALYRRADALRAGFYEHDVIGSDSVSLLCLLPGRRAGFLDRFVAVWRNHGNNASLANAAHDVIANFKVADVPAASPGANAAFDSITLQRWRRVFSAQLGYRALANQLAAGHLSAALQVAWFMLCSRPRALALALGLLAPGTLRYLRHKQAGVSVTDGFHT